MEGTGDRALSVGIIGAGIAGLSAAEALGSAGHRVTCIDKGRGVSGRASTRRADPYRFDHGAQYFTARDPRFRARVDEWVAEGVAARWDGRIAVIDRAGDAREHRDGPERFVGTPGMNAVAKHMAQGLDVRTSTRALALHRSENGWSIEADVGPSLGPFDVVLVSTPAAQALPFVESSAELTSLAQGVAMEPCLAAMVAFERPYDVPFDGAFVNVGGLAWICRDSSKPGRSAGDAWVLHAGAAWSRAHVEHDRGEIASLLIDELVSATGRATPPVAHVDVHRWMYSLARDPLEAGAVFDAAAGLGLCGDWLCGSKVQGAWLSGRKLAELVDLHCQSASGPSGAPGSTDR